MTHAFTSYDFDQNLLLGPSELINWFYVFFRDLWVLRYWMVRSIVAHLVKYLSNQVKTCRLKFRMSLCYF